MAADADLVDYYAKRAAEYERIDAKYEPRPAVVAFIFSRISRGSRLKFFLFV
jgi:hypothetical protein